MPVEGEAGGGDGGRAHRRKIDCAPRCGQALEIAKHELRNRGKVVAESIRLGWLAMRVGDDQRVALASGYVDQHTREAPQAPGKVVDACLERQLEQRVVDVVARSARMKAPGQIWTETQSKFLLDKEEEVFHLTRIDERRHNDLAVDCDEGLRDGTRLIDLEDASLGQHHEMSAVDPTKAVNVMRFRPLEQGTEDRLFVGGIGKGGAVGRSRIVASRFGCHSHPLSPAITTPRTM